MFFSCSFGKWSGSGLIGKKKIGEILKLGFLIGEKNQRDIEIGIFFNWEKIGKILKLGFLIGKKYNLGILKYLGK